MPARLSAAAVAVALLAASAAPAQQGPRLERPSLSVAADFAADMSPDGPTLRDSSRLAVRELELGASASFAGITGVALVRARDASHVDVHQAYLEAGLPLGLRARAGRFALPFGHLNEVHGHALPTLEAPVAHVRYLGDANVAGTGVSLSRALGDRLELTLSAVDQLRRDTTGARALDLPNQYLSGLGYVGRLAAQGVAGGVRTRLDLSAMTGRRLQPLSDRAVAGAIVVDAVVARQSVIGAEVAVGPADSTERWGVVGQLLYQLNERGSSVERRIPLNPATGGPFYEGPVRDVVGGSLTARAPLWRRLALVVRGDLVQESDAVGGTTTSLTALGEWRTAAGLLLSGGYEAVEMPERDTLHRVLARVRVAVGERPAWPF